MNRPSRLNGHAASLAASLQADSPDADSSGTNPALTELNRENDSDQNDAGQQKYSWIARWEQSVGDRFVGWQGKQSPGRVKKWFLAGFVFLFAYAACLIVSGLYNIYHKVPAKKQDYSQMKIPKITR